MADLKSTRVFGWLKVFGSVDTTGEIKEKGERVFSPNNRNITSSLSNTSETTYAATAAVKLVNDKCTQLSDSLSTRVRTDVPVGAVFTDTQNPIANNLTTNEATSSLSAAQGVLLKQALDSLSGSVAGKGVFKIENGMSSPRYDWIYSDVVIEFTATSDTVLDIGTSIDNARIGDRVLIRNISGAVLTLQGLELLDEDLNSLGASNTVSGKGEVSLYLNSDSKLVKISSIKR